MINGDLTIKNIKNTDWKIISEISVTEWGKTAVIKDYYGRKIELKTNNALQHRV